ncbi:MAG: hypothetical protein H6740_23735 [Alphaproteobacteria bacterium]|nr:hypothetical protein [Alphaproteobacteria bacterium]
MNARWIGAAVLLFGCKQPAPVDSSDSEAPDWSQAHAAEVRTAFVDPEGEHVHSMVLADGDMFATTTNAPNHVDDDLIRVSLPAEGTQAAVVVERVFRALPFPEGIDVGPDGALYTACWNDFAVHRTTLDGADEVYSEGVDNPTNVHFDAAGDLLISNWNRSTIARVSAEGGRSTFSASPDYAGPHGMDHDEDGQLYVANFLDGKVFRVDEEGQAELLAQLPGATKLGHLVWLDGNLFATAADLHQLYRITPEGELSVFAGSGEAGDADGDPSGDVFDTPNGLAADPENHQLYVSMGATVKVVPLAL